MHDITPELFADPETIEPIAPQSSQRQQHTSSHCHCAMRLELRWQSPLARHRDCLVLPKLNLWRDIFPPALEQQLMDQSVGARLQADFAAGELVSGYRQQDCLEIKGKSFNRDFRRGMHVDPRSGRFYPKGFIAGVKGIYKEDMSPFRVAECRDSNLLVDLNHPLAGQPMHVTATLLDIWSGGDEHGGACQDIAERITANGPGMQMRWREQATDFWSDMPFLRMARGPDADFYAQPRMTDHIDKTAAAQLQALYAGLLPDQAEVLDLMSSWTSHLPADRGYAVSGLGMNEQELAANPLLGDRQVQDLNLEPVLPYADDRFDAALCSLSIEYLIEPRKVFEEVRRVLKPGGLFIVTFSNRWFPPKVTRIWQDIHEFERLGLVLEHFLDNQGFADLETWSLRGLPRPLDDKYAVQSGQSDPLFGVWGRKS